MALTNAQKQRALKWFAAKNAGKGCPVCGASTFKAERDAGLEDVPPAPTLIHVILIGCLDCGHLMMFNSSICEQEDEDEEIASEED